MKPLTLLLCLLWFGALGQSTDNEIDWQRFLDNYAIQESDDGAPDQFETFVMLINDPINLNRATAEDLRLLWILNENQIKALLDHRNTFGNFRSIYELQSIAELDSATLRMILPMITIAEPSQTLEAIGLKRFLNDGHGSLALRNSYAFERKEGFRSQDTSRAFIGSPVKSLLRFRLSHQHDFSIGLTLEKDAGEANRWNVKGRQYGPDFISFHFQLQDKGRLTNLILGDYTVSAGQGLVMGAGFRLGKGADPVLGASRGFDGALPYSGTAEYSFFHGVYSKFKVSRRLDLSGFYSSLYKDASLNEDGSIRSISESGLHRTLVEVDKRKNVREQTVGAALDYSRKNLSIGLLAVRNSYPKPILPSSTLYNQFTATSQSTYAISTYMRYHHANVSMFSELAYSGNNAFAGYAGIQVAMSKRFDYTLSYRNYSRSYVAPYANGFGESSTTNNERGIFTAGKLQLNKRFSTVFYFDLFRFPWLRYRVYKPSAGYEWMVRTNYIHQKNTLLFALFREEVKDRNANDEGARTTYTLPITKQTFAVGYQSALSGNIKTRTRVQLSRTKMQQSKDSGAALVQDFKFHGRKLDVSFRFALFETADYDNRLYVYEDDLWSSFSFPAYYGNGSRVCWIVSYKLFKTLTLSARYARTQYDSLRDIGNGVDGIYDDHQSEIKLQLRYTF